MQKDIVLKKLTEHNDVFADIFNNLVCEGVGVLDPEALRSEVTEAGTCIDRCLILGR